MYSLCIENKKNGVIDLNIKHTLYIHLFGQWHSFIPPTGIFWIYGYNDGNSKYRRWEFLWHDAKKKENSAPKKWDPNEW